MEVSIGLEPLTYYKLFFNLAILVICIVSTSINILILKTISKYKDKKRPINIYLHNFLICDIIYIVANTIEYQMRSNSLHDFSSEISCITLSFANTVRSIDILFFLMLIYQWFFEKTRVTLFETYPQFISLCLWCLLFLQITTLLTTCSINLNLHYGENSLGLAITLFEIFLCVFMIIRKCANPFSKIFGSLAIAVTNALPIFWTIPLLTGFIASHFNLNSELARAVIQAINMSVFLYPLITFCMFYRMDKKFKTGLKIVFGKDVSTQDKLDFCDDDQDIKMGAVVNSSFSKVDES